MRPCICSIRAFELFVKDLSGLTLRSSRPRSHVSSYQSPRRFGAMGRLRTLEPAAGTRVNEDFVPFQSEATGREFSSEKENAKDGAAERRQGAQADEEDLDDEWHAEIEIVAPWPQQTQYSSATDASAVETEHGELDNVHPRGPEGYTVPSTLR